MTLQFDHSLSESAGAEPALPGLVAGHGFAVRLVWLLLVTSLLAWRSGIYYSGGFDTVVVAKALLDVLALLICLWLVGREDVVRRPLGMSTILLVTLFVLASLLGAAAAGTLFASGVLGLRLLIILAAVALLVTVCETEQLLRTFVQVMGGLGVLCAVTGAGSLAEGGRLMGGVLPIAPNQIGLLVGVPIIWSVWRMVHARSARWDVLTVVGGLGITWLTGSRSGLAALLVATVLILVLAPRLRLGGLLVLLGSLPALFFGVAFTALFAGYFGRGGAENLTSLNSRTIAWEAAFSADQDFWRHWFGGGLSVKLVSVSGTYWDSQVLDSSWVSTFVQVGVVGLVLLVVYVLTGLFQAFRSPQPYRGLWVGLVVYAVLRSILETGLLDSYVLFVVMALPALVADLKTSASPAGPSPRVDARERQTSPRR